MILMIDNYDSFTYNLYQIFLKHNYKIDVVRNDKITIEEIKKINPDYIVLSPGPGRPEDAGICIDIIKTFSNKIPILGICLGHQAILYAFGVPIVNASEIVHGKVHPLIHDSKGIFRNIPQNTPVTRYHSLCGKEKDIPDCLDVTARTPDKEVMAVRHKTHQLVGLQFHPESIDCDLGEKMILNFLNYRRDNVPVKEYLSKITVKGEDLTFEEAYDIMDELTEGNLHESQIGSLLTALKIKGVKAQELAGFAAVLRKKALDFPEPDNNEVRIDTCGTGGSHEQKTFNISTIVSIILAAAGAKVVKHGNRAVTSKCGSADLLEKIGINVNISNEKSYDVYKKCGVTFLYARKYHAAMRFAGPTRSSLGFSTAFNFIGPLSNPAYANYQLLGVYDPEMTEIIAEALKILCVKKAIVVSGLEGYDEISLVKNTKITELNDGDIKTYIFNPEDIGIKKVNHSELKGGSIEDNYKIAMNIFNGKEGAKTDLVCLNAGFALYLYGISDSIKAGVEKAKTILKSGKALETLNLFVKESNS